MALAIGLYLSAAPFQSRGVPIDYYEFWAAGYLVTHGENPYDPARMLEIQNAAGMSNDVPVMMWHPPWTLLVVLPFGLLSLSTGCLIWTYIQMGSVFGAVDLTWRALGGTPDRRWIAWGLAIAFSPTIFAIATGQVTGMCLLGVAGFMAATRANRPMLAGAAAALTAIKPHLLALFGLALVLDTVRTSAARKVILTGAAVLGAALLVVIAFDPAILSQYSAAVTDRDGTNPYKVTDILSPTAGSYLRANLAPGSFAVALVPLMVGSCVVVGAWWARRKTWDSARAAPWLAGGSFLAAPYGAWIYDLVLMLPVILAAAVPLFARGARPRARLLAAAWYVGVSAGIIALTSRTTTHDQIVMWWVAPTVFVGSALTLWANRPARAVA
ncbi:glycosyltransferase family 87 protein [Fimbriiglobus ruber]|nr:glycosyltransferase family 87 protein [Fimbriiglobus ruber]